jgi:GH43 family beta-xylosidase
MDNANSYLNPVYDQVFPDPFVLKYCGVYWAYSTGFAQDGRAFAILRSRDLVNWQAVGGAMAPLPGNHPCYWAPEVTYENGRFYLYYSVGNETEMHLRLATADHPAGPFIDAGVRLTEEPFAIDAHLFRDEDGSRYLFYATDFLEHERIGTGTVMAPLVDPFTLAGEPRPVTRARYDWQIYDPQRSEKGGVRWHTLEGPFVLKRKGIYYQMFSGGNWQNPSYGVAYATTESLERPGEWRQWSDGEWVRPILHTVPGRVIGPGHNSAVRGPDNRQLYCVYHRWGNGTGRLLAVDPLDFAGQRMFILGPSFTPRPQPLPPTFADFFEADEPDERWQVSGSWHVGAGAAVAVASSEAAAVLAHELPQLPFLAEVSLRAVADGDGGYGLSLQAGPTTLFRLCLKPQQQQANVIWQEMNTWQMRPVSLPLTFRFEAYHQLRWELNGRCLLLSLDDRALWQGELSQMPDRIALFAKQMEAAFAGFALTIGWQDCFDGEESLVDLAWESKASSDWSIRQQQLTFASADGESLLQKGPLLSAYELVVNVRLLDFEAAGCYGIAPILAPDGSGPLFTVEAEGAGWIARWQDGETVERFVLPDNFDPTTYQQFRFRKVGGRLTIHWEQVAVAALSVTADPTHVGLYGRFATAAFDMVRVTAITQMGE